ncbi:hypothetical protein [Bartonella jaculi]|uniref:hypothetical protein n=1 Tax=Bartonella jaculi TaxID=686226 RepID=UPI0031ED9120
MKRQSRPQTVCKAGGENRSGMNPGVAGSNPAVDTIVSVKLFVDAQYRKAL